ncbi:MAG TPA: hypothetical protein VLF71_01120 [Candidatus Saccharimonadales bacterium]|nr:hypothetical protein [Candidatus Saccharimonadales bacterium]
MRVKAILTSITVTAASIVGLVAPAATAHADTTCQSGPVYWPTTGQVTTANGAQHSITLTFKLTQTQLNALQCLGGYLKMDFTTQNAGVSGDNYTLTTNTGGVKDSPPLGSGFTPGITAVGLGSLVAGKLYTVTTTWTGGTAVPTFTADWIGAHWAASFFEKSLCQSGQNKGTQAWCVFQTGTFRHSLTGGIVPADGSTYQLQ